MWCSTCKQEVPVVAVGGTKSDDATFGERQHPTGAVVCTCCLQVIESTPSRWTRIDDAHTPSRSPDSAPQANEPPEFPVGHAALTEIDESIDESIDDAERLSNLGLEFPVDVERPIDVEARFSDDMWMDHDLLQAKVAINSYRRDNGHDISITRRDVASGSRRGSDVAQSATFETTRASETEVTRWGIVCLGVMVFTFGGVLALWSLVDGNERLWHIGLPTCLAGQTILLFALAIQLDRLWKTHQQTQATVHRVREATLRLAGESAVRDEVNVAN